MESFGMVCIIFFAILAVVGLAAWLNWSLDKCTECRLLRRTNELLIQNAGEAERWRDEAKAKFSRLKKRIKEVAEENV